MGTINLVQAGLRYVLKTEEAGTGKVTYQRMPAPGTPTQHMGTPLTSADLYNHEDVAWCVGTLPPVNPGLQHLMRWADDFVNRLEVEGKE